MNEVWLDIFSLQTMRKYVPISFLLLVLFTNAVIAQKKPIKKSTPPNDYPVPMVMESSEATKFRKERICTTCDTLKLEVNKPHIIIYDVKWMSDTQARTYRRQPTNDDLTNTYYALKGQNKREWDELQRSFPEGKFVYHYVFRNTYIETPNQKHEVLNLLDRQERHEGFLYWSGKANENAINRKKMALLTEVVAKATGEKKTSSYYKDFQRDSLAIVNFQKTVNPSANLTAQMNVLVQKEVLRETIIPLQFLNIKGISKITVQSELEKEKKITVKFNNKGQITQLLDGRRDSTIITYKNDLPLVAKKGDQIVNFYYRSDTVTVKENNYLKVHKLVGKMFLEIERYNVGPDDYVNMILADDQEIELIDGKNTCITQTAKNGEKSEQTCYSNTNWELPLSIVTKSNDGTETKTYSKNNEDNLVVENLNRYKSTRLEYVATDGKMTTLKSTVKRGESAYGEPYFLNISYEYFK